MGGGVILEQGTHNELLVDGNSVYSRLVQAQNLRERHEATALDVDGSSTPVSGEDEDNMKTDHEERRLARKDTAHSLTSDVYEKATGDIEQAHRDTDYSLPYLFKRIGLINRGAWPVYIVGSIFAISKGLLTLLTQCLLTILSSVRCHAPGF